MDVGDVGESRADAFAQRQRRLDRGMAAPAARIGLDAVTQFNDIPAPAEIVERLVGDLEPAAEGAK